MHKWMTQKFKLANEKHQKEQSHWKTRAHSVEHSSSSNNGNGRSKKDTAAAFSNFDVSYAGNTATITHLLNQRTSATVQTANFQVNLRQRSATTIVAASHEKPWQ